MRLKQQEKYKVVVDTNLVVSALLSEEGSPAIVFELILLELIENYTSKEIIEEIKEVFKREKIRSRVKPEQIDFIINNFETYSRRVDPEISLNVVKEDPDDDKFFEVAVTANANYIISGNKHVQAIKSFKDVKVMSPKEFLNEFKPSS